MKTLVQSLMDADQICQKANVHFEAETDLQQKADALLGIFKKRKKFWLIGGFVLLLFLKSLFPNKSVESTISVIVGLPPLILGYWKHKSAVQAKADRLQKQAQSENAAGLQILEENCDALSFLPSDYWYPLATGYLTKVIQSNRANSLSAALDLFDTQLHRWKVEEANAEIVAQQQAQTAHLKSIRTSSKVNAAANVANTMFNIAKEFC